MISPNPEFHEADRPLDPVIERDRVWTARVRAGDQQAFVDMFDEYAPRLCAFVNAQIRAPDASEEIVQDLFLGIWVNRLIWEVPGPLKMYLYRAALNRIINYRRRVHREIALHAAVAHEMTVIPDEARLHSDARLNDDELRAAIAAAVTQMPERCRQVWSLSREHHLTHKEIAALLDISVKTVELHMGRAFIALRRLLANWR